MMIEGSGSGVGSGSIPLTSGSGSGRPKNMWIRWIRIRNTDFFCNTWYVGLAPVVDDHNTARCERLGGNGMTE
jgi:hypothetical protein